MMDTREVYKLNSRERMVAALQGKQPDCVPYFEAAIDSSIIKEFGGKDFTFADFVETLDLDGILATIDFDFKSIGNNAIEDEWGIIRKFGEGGDYPVAAGGVYARIKTSKDLKTYRAPDLEKRGRFKTLKQIVDRFKERKLVVIKLHDVWSIPRDLLGYERLLISVINNRELVYDVIRLSVDYHKRAAEMAAEIGADAIMTTDDIAGNKRLIVSPETWTDVFWPSFKELFEYFKSLGLYTIKHSDGNIMSIMDKLASCVDCINPIDQMAGMRLKEVKEKYGSSVAIMGNVDCVHILVDGGREESAEEVKRWIREGGGQGGYILSSSNSIHSGIPLANYLVMLDTWKRMRKYPPKVEVEDYTT
jgi:uroporphyrinogen decarboxylase